MKIIIIEDEQPAAAKLAADLGRLDAPPEIVAILNSVSAAVRWFQHNPQPDLILSDIELTDGLSFTIFEKVAFSCPIIFITAYDEYWQKAFESNSIDYILKPAKKEKLQAALDKFDKLRQHFSANFQQLMDAHKESSGFKKRFLVKQGNNLISVKAEEIAYCYAVNKLICMVDMQGKQYLLDDSLSDIESQLDPSIFYRINRKYVANIDAISRISTYGKGKLLLQLNPPVKDEVIVSPETVQAFKAWMTR